MRRIALLLLCFGLVVVAGCEEVSREVEGPPNIVLFLVDDLGWSDLSCQGSSFYETPNIDSLAARGLRFTNAYSNGPNCAPTRASLMTGQYSPRHGVYTVGDPWRAPKHERRLAPPESRTELGLEAVTIAELLQGAGYATGFIGKWHLGTPGVGGPEEQGFDQNIAGTMAGAPKTYFSPYQIETLADGPEGEYLTDRLAEEAVGFIRANHASPFFLLLSHFAVHMPIQAPPERSARYEARPAWHGQSDAEYAAMIESVDLSLGRVLAELERLDLTEQTIVFLASDNGGVGGYESSGVSERTITDNFPLKGGKGQLYEGGIRVPMMASWPGQIEAGSVVHDPVISVDLYPTFADLAGVSRDIQRSVDGESLLPLLTESARLKRRALYWYFPAYLGKDSSLRTSPAAAVRKGDLKLIWFFEDDSLEMYDLGSDIGEKKNLVAEDPENASALHELLKGWMSTVGAPFPQVNPFYGKAEPTSQAGQGQRTDR